MFSRLSRSAGRLVEGFRRPSMLRRQAAGLGRGADHQTVPRRHGRRADRAVRPRASLKSSDFGMGAGAPAPGTTLVVSDAAEISIETKCRRDAGPMSARLVKLVEGAARRRSA